MNTGVKLGLFVAGLALLFGAAFGLGRVVGADPAPAPHETVTPGGHGGHASTTTVPVPATDAAKEE